MEWSAYHAEPCALGSTSVSANSKELLEEISTLSLTALNLKQLVGVVHISGGLDGRKTQTLDGSEGLVKVTPLHVPSRTFRAEVHLEHDNQGRDRGRGHHPSPWRCLAADDGDLFECNTNNET